MEPGKNEDGKFEYTLKTPIQYASGGDNSMASFLMFSAPSSRNSKEAGAIRQAVMQGLREQLNNDKMMARMDAAKEAADHAAEVDDEIDEESMSDDERADLEKKRAQAIEDAKPSGIQVVNMIAMAEKVDYGAFLGVVRKFFSTGDVVMVQGTKSMNTQTCDRLSLLDLESAAGEYISNFINTSA